MTAARHQKTPPEAPTAPPTDGQESEEPEIFRLEDLCCLPDGRIVIADHANGILIYGSSEIERHLNSDKDSLAFAVGCDPTKSQLIALILDRPGWTVNIYAIDNNFQLVTQILVPQEPEVDRMKLRWLSVTSDGDIFVMAGGLIWKLRNRGTSEWSLIHQDKRTGAWFSHLTKIPGSSDRFLICYKGDVVLEVTINAEGFNETSKVVIGPTLVEELGTYTLDSRGNLLVSDWKTGDIKFLDSDYKLIGKVGNAGSSEPSFMATYRDIVFVGCKQTLIVKAFRYMDSE